MSTGHPPLLWLCGPPGVGKSTVGWEVYRDLRGSGVPAAFLDADQLGLCYPAPEDDPHNHRVKAGALGAVWPVFRSAGARCLVLSGGVASPGTVRAYAEQVPDTALTLCRLRVGRDELRDRFAGRGWLAHLTDEILRHADELDRDDFADLCVDSEGLSVSETARTVRERAGGWPGPAPGGGARALVPEPEAVAQEEDDGGARAPFVWICGPSGVGKSTVGWEVFGQVVAAGVKAAYVDLDQIGFRPPAADGDPDDHRVKARALGAMWRVFRAAGAGCLIVSGPVGDQGTVRAYADAVPKTRLRLCRLRAGHDRLAERVLLRGRGQGPAIPNDALKGLPEEALRAHARRAAAEADALDAAGIGDVAVDTDGRAVEEVARSVRAAAGLDGAFSPA